MQGEVAALRLRLENADRARDLAVQEAVSLPSTKKRKKRACPLKRLRFIIFNPVRQIAKQQAAMTTERAEIDADIGRMQQRIASLEVSWHDLLLS